MIMVLAACQNQPPEPEDAEQPVSQETVTRIIDPVVLHNLLDQAEEAIAQDHLTYPADNSAYAIYMRILDMQPGQEDALRGLEHIVEQYIALAMRALQRHRYASARSMLSRARLINPDHPSIEPTEQQIRLLSEAQRDVLKLTQAQLTNPDTELAEALRAMARQPANANCRFTISAKNDAQGRWIYQRLSEAGGPAEASARIRAQIRIALPAAVERLCFPT